MTRPLRLWGLLCIVGNVCFHCLAGPLSEKEVFFDVTDFGAIGNGIAEDTQAIRSALSAAATVSQGRRASPKAVVLLPQGKTFVSAPLNLSSHSVLQVDGTLQAITNETTDFELKWPQMPPLPSYGNSIDLSRYLQYQGFIYAKDSHDITIRGTGTIDAQGGWWWDSYRRHLKAARPNLLKLVNCTDIEITGVTLKDSPFWCLHPVYCKNMHIHHMKVRSRLYAPNVDGIDPDSSSNVVIEHNDVSCGDDHIAIKAGRCGAGSSNDCNDPLFRNVGPYTTSNITIRHNMFRTGMGIALGSDVSGGIQNVQVYDNVIGACESGHDSANSCGWGPAIHLKTKITHSGFLRNIVFRNNTIYNNSMFLFLETSYQSRGAKPPKYPTTDISNFTVVGNRGLGSAVGINFACSEHIVCEDLTIEDNDIVHAKSTNWHCSYVDTYKVSGNYPPGLEDCMYHSMNRSLDVSLPSREQ